MKSFSLLLFILPAAVASNTEFLHREKSIVSLPPRTAARLQLRGGAELRGGSVPSSLSDGPPSIEPPPLAPKEGLELASQVLLYLFGGVNAFHGFILAFAPSLGSRLLGTPGATDDDDAAYAEEAIGAFALEYGLTGYLAAADLCAPEKAIGYGTLPDLYFLLKHLLVDGTFARFGVQRVMTVMTLVAAACTATILMDKLHLGPVIEILTVIPAVQGGFKYFAPVGAAKRMMGADLTDKPVARALYRHSGQMKIVSAVLRGSIAFGVKPLKALGYSLLADAVLVLDSLLIRKTAKDIGKASAFYHQVGALILAATMGTVFVMAA